MLLLQKSFLHKMKNFLFLIYVLLLTSSCKKSSDVNPDTTLFFPKVKAIISSNCLSCHDSKGDWTGRPTAFDTDEQITSLASKIKASVADPITIRNKRMPQGGELKQADKDLIVSWFNKGGKATD